MKPTDRGPLTNWKQQREGLVKIRKETNQPRPTHSLGMAARGDHQDVERNRPSKSYLHPRDGRGRDLSGHRKNRPTEPHSPAGDGRGRDLSER